jgi:hypothetical protein
MMAQFKVFALVYMSITNAAAWLAVSCLGGVEDIARVSVLWPKYLAQGVAEGLVELGWLRLEVALGWPAAAVATAALGLWARDHWMAHSCARSS